MLAKDNAKVDKVLDFEVPDSVLVERVTGRWIHPESGRSYHTKFAPPKVPGKDDVSCHLCIIFVGYVNNFRWSPVLVCIGYLWSYFVELALPKVIRNDDVGSHPLFNSATFRCRLILVVCRGLIQLRAKGLLNFKAGSICLYKSSKLRSSAR
jgi:hypothetical protein